MVVVAKELQDRELASAFVRPVATAYMRAVLAGKGGDAAKAREDLRRAMIGFPRQLEGYSFLNQTTPCDEAKTVAEKFQRQPTHAEKLHQLLDLHRELPYGHIVYAIFTDFFGDPASGVLMLQRWEDGRSGASGGATNDTDDTTGEEALHLWVGYVARTFQNILMTKIPNDLLKTDEHGYDWGARRILARFRPDFTAALEREDYCNGGTFDRDLMEIYRLSIQESEDELSLLFDRKKLDIFSAFSDRSIHVPARHIAGYDRFTDCFGMIYGLEHVENQRAEIHDLLGRYKTWHAIYVLARGENTYYPEHWPVRLCQDAIEHFDLALSLLSKIQFPDERKKRLVGMLSMESSYSAARLKQRLTSQLYTLHESDGCERWR